MIQMNTHLFLFGGAPPFTTKMAKNFVKIASRSDGPVSILFIEREGWEKYMSRYTCELEDFGLKDFDYLPLPSTPIEKVQNCLRNSSGIMIGGGNTNVYADYIVETPISTVIQEKYEEGTPIAGFSAGALISPEICIISAKDNDQNVFQSRKGLGLLSDVSIAVHFSQWNDEAHLRHAVKQFKHLYNYGIDENTGVYLRNGQIEATEGDGVYRIKNDVLYTINKSFV